MKYCVRIVVPGTKNSDTELDRLPGYTAEFTKEERADVVQQLPTIAPQVIEARGLYNDTIPETANQRAKIEVYPLYDSQNVIVDMIVNMPDSSLALVPIAAIEAAPLTEAQKTTAYERLARLEVNSMPQQLQDVLPDVIGGA